MLLLAALLAASAAPPANPTGASAQARATVRIVRGAALRGDRIDLYPGEDRPSKGRLLVTNPDGSRQTVLLHEFP